MCCAVWAAFASHALRDHALVHMRSKPPTRVGTPTHAHPRVVLVTLSSSSHLAPGLLGSR